MRQWIKITSFIFSFDTKKNFLVTETYPPYYQKYISHGSGFFHAKIKPLQNTTHSNHAALKWTLFEETEILQLLIQNWDKMDQAPSKSILSFFFKYVAETFYF